MHVSMMESSSLPFGNHSGQNITETRSELAGRQSTYMTNMILPDMVQSSKNFPLGPDCIITYADVPDQSVLLSMDLYWLISLENGCVECKVHVSDTSAGRKAITHDARVIITRKPRRFEAYCCGVCRANFVTVVQALLHMKAFHRQNKKILIQDQNVFHDIEKAMEVPPVPLPWYVAKRVTEQGIQISNIQPVGSSSDSDTPTTNAGSFNEGEGNPVTVLLQAIVKEYKKPVHAVLFGEDFAEVKVQFEDKTSLVAHLPDLAGEQMNENTEIDPSAKLEFQIQRVKTEGDESESCIVRVNNPTLAQRLMASALKQGVEQGSGTDLAGQDEEGSSKETETEKFSSRIVKQNENSHVSSSTGEKEDKPVDSPAPAMKLNSKGRPTKTVRFMVGSPDSDEDCSSTASDRTGGRDSVSPNTSNVEKETTGTTSSTTENQEKQNSTADEKKPSKEDEGLQGVVNQLISTASKGIIAPVDPGSPANTSTVTSSASVREEILATAAYHARYLPKNRSVPNFSTFTMPTSSVTVQPISIKSVEDLSKQGMIRVQSWGGGGGGDPQRFSLSTYTPNTPQNFDHMSREELRKSFAVGRAFTYAEKIRLMKKLNDEDSLLTQEHVRGTGKLIESEIQSSIKKSRKSSSSSISNTTESSIPVSPTVTSTTTIGSKMKLKVSESDPGQESIKRKIMIVEPQQPDVKKKRRSKYDVPKFMQNQESGVDKLRPFVSTGSRKHNLSSSDGSISDRDDEHAENNTMDESDEPPSLFDMMRENFPAGLFAAQAAHTPATSFPSMLSSEYYGSGEWASAAMQTLHNLQTTMKSAQSSDSVVSKSEQHSRTDSHTEEDSDSRSSSPFVNINVLNMANPGSETSTSSFVPLSSATSLKSTSSVDTIMALANQITAEKSHIKHLNLPSETTRSRSERKRSLSPLLTQDEKEMIRARAGPSEVSNSKNGKDNNLKVISKSISDSSLKRRTSSSESKSSFKIADKGDSLEFMKTITTSSVKKNTELTMKFCKNSSNDSDSNTETSTNSHEQLFQNSVETVMKVKYIEKVNMCRVCGFSLLVDENNNATAMKSHVMEHSLKELIQAGCNGKTT
ncbi:uncharacterized protein LOC120342030 [Styela clava]